MKFPKTLTQEEFLKNLEESYKKNVEISRAKNSDYAGGGDDAFKNFRACEAFGVDMAQGIMVRMSDKFSRLASLIAKDNVGAVKDESVSDTLSDLANYAMILKALIECQK